jgi:thymidylate synthase (FAD)
MNKKIDLYGDEIGCVEYVQHMGTDLTIVNAARVSFGVNKDEVDERDRKLIRYLVKNRHTSTLEHNVITFKFTVPLFVRGQHHRHRTWSYNEISRRYTDMNIAFYEPKTFRTQHKTNRQASNLDETNPLTKLTSTLGTPLKADNVIRNIHRQSLESYEALIESGVCREQARGILPQNLYTEYYGTCNLNNLIKFIVLREDDHAQWEIQQVAKACREIATELWPVAMATFNQNFISEKPSL